MKNGRFCRGKKYVCCDVWDCFSVRSWVLVENPLRPGGSSATFLPFLRSLQDHLRAGKIEDGLRQAFSCWRTPLLKTFKTELRVRPTKIGLQDDFPIGNRFSLVSRIDILVFKGPWVNRLVNGWWMDDCIYMYLQVWWKTNDRISITILLLNIKDIQRLVFFAGQPYMMKPAVYVYIYILFRVQSVLW